MENKNYEIIVPEVEQPDWKKKEQLMQAYRQHMKDAMEKKKEGEQK